MTEYSNDETDDVTESAEIPTWDSAERGSLIWWAWVAGQVCYLPIAPARYLHDLIGYLTAFHLYDEYVDEIVVRRRGYRLDWRVRWKPNTPRVKKRITLLMPVLVGVAVFSVLVHPFILVPYFDPVRVNEFFTPLERALIELVAAQAIAFPWPRVRDIPRWLVWGPVDEEERGGEVSDS